MMTSDLHNEYTAIQQIAAGQELQWEDQLENSTFRPGYRLADMLDLPSLSKKLTSPGGKNLILSTLDKNFSRRYFEIIFLFFPETMQVAHNVLPCGGVRGQNV